MDLVPVSEKQREAIKNSCSRLNIWEGAVRSGKSFSSLLRWIEFIKDGPPGEMIAVGRTEKTIFRNIVKPMLEMLGIDLKYYSGKGEISLWGRKVYLVGASDERAQGKIQGSEFIGAYVDEAALLPENFFKMLLSRLFKDEAKLFATTNPDSPFHWLKTDYIDNPNLDIKTFKFTLDDNPVITEAFKRNISQEYRGLWYKRYILGEWTLAEGTIYDFFDNNIHTIDIPPGFAKYYIVGVDYGTTNPTAFALIGYSPSTFPNLWVEKEYYYDSRKEMQQKTDAEYADDLKKFIEGHLVEVIYLDPSAASFKTELQRAHVSNVQDAANDVLDGIRFVGTLLNQGTLKISKRCTNLIKEMQTYRWDEKSVKLGIDKPLKENDHCFAKDTQVLTIEGNKNIQDISIDDYVITPLGPKKVLKTFKHLANVCEYNILGKKIKCTPNHKFFTVNGWKEVRNINEYDILMAYTGNLWTTKKPISIQENIERINSAQSPVPINLGKQEVYNLMIEDTPVYFAENILVHNCSDALRYACYTHFHGKNADEGISQEEWRRLKYKQSGYKPQDIDDFMRPGW